MLCVTPDCALGATSNRGAEGPDPQLELHSDTFHPSLKAWLFLTDVPEDGRPLTYVAGSHRLTPDRLAWEKRRTVEIDEADRLFPCTFCDDVFGKFRAWHNERALDPDGPWRQFSLILVYSTQANLFIKNMNQSGNTATYTMECKGEPSMKADNKITFVSDGFDMDMKMQMNRGGQVMNMTQKMNDLITNLRKSNNVVLDDAYFGPRPEFPQGLLPPGAGPGPEPR